MEQVTNCEELARKFEALPLCGQIVKFFLGHPDAVDTLEGIADWWVQEDRRSIRDALDRLVALGLVVRRVRGGRELFSYAADSSLRALVEEWHTRPKAA